MKTIKFIFYSGLIIFVIALFQGCSLNYDNSKLLTKSFKYNIINENVNQLNLDSSSDYILFLVFDSYELDEGCLKKGIKYKEVQYLFLFDKDKNNEVDYNFIKIVYFSNFQNHVILNNKYQVINNDFYSLLDKMEKNINEDNCFKTSFEEKIDHTDYELIIKYKNKIFKIESTESNSNKELSLAFHNRLIQILFYNDYQNNNRY
ncbi:MAG: hypothetical protein NTW25_15565 [Candidatus Kapabacteria bacterium]|nr:hypothetical protein [Candidatus Kapabacteria bacterium]